MKKTRINLIGSGNVASHLGEKLMDEGVEVVNVYSRSIENATILANKVSAEPTDNIQKLSNNVDLNIISISDGAIIEISKELNKSVGVVHTSGSISIEVLQSFENHGILYPLQTFTKNRTLEIHKIPFFIEANNSNFQEKLLTFCKTYLSENCHIADSQVREDLHLAAVVSSNFLTYLMYESQSILAKRNLPLSILEELLKETVNKSIDIGPLNAQTGPAKRKDEEVINRQLKKLKREDFNQVYRLLTNLIIKSQSTL